MAITRPPRDFELTLIEPRLRSDGAPRRHRPAAHIRLPAMGAVQTPAPPAAPPHSPVHIPFPDPEALDRARMHRKAAAEQAENLAFAKRREQQHAVAVAYENGKDAGERQGYTMGWHWGLCCGGVAGALLIACIVMLRAWSLGA